MDENGGNKKSDMSGLLQGLAKEAAHVTHCINNAIKLHSQL
jgi:hypothetical protein